MTDVGEFGKGILPIFRSVIYGLLVLAMVSAPISYSGNVQASDLQSHFSSAQTGEFGTAGHNNRDHKLHHCGSLICSPFYRSGSLVDYPPFSNLSKMQKPNIDDTLVKSLYLDCDPPVPRRGFSKA